MQPLDPHARSADSADGLDEVPVSSGLELRPGMVLGRKYVLLRQLGSGGMGQVWVARNEATLAEVAIKALRADQIAPPDALARFRREAYATASLAHRGVVRVFDLVELDDPARSLLLVMELLHGETLASRLHRQPRLALGESLEIAIAILSALDHAHSVGIVHRDLKPENVFLARDPDGRILPKLLDFGISKTIAEGDGEGEVLGTPGYMSPEQASGEADVDARSDLFSLGVVLYEMISGRNPFLVDTRQPVLLAVLGADPKPIDGIPPALWREIARAMAKPRAHRHASARALADALAAAAPGFAPRSDDVLSGRRAPPPRPGRAPAFAGIALRKRRAARGLVALAAATSLCAYGGVAGNASSSTIAPAPSSVASVGAPIAQAPRAAAIARAPDRPASIASIASGSVAPPIAPAAARDARTDPPGRAIAAAAPTPMPAPTSAPPFDPFVPPPVVVIRDPGF